ncbi:hypothetical protein ACK318_04500, partial [Aeromonas dhakensis]|uniref:hypothetical protein n=1 Tax=Aeromonas dhakensis TaxID=196024 RepID=UPI0039876716
LAEARGASGHLPVRMPSHGSTIRADLLSSYAIKQECLITISDHTGGIRCLGLWHGSKEGGGMRVTTRVFSRLEQTK